ncbi:MAG: transcription repressor NadR [Oscillospiraceae bacterium]|nr:transcription repressor NadR [Oscillospiraceae bacterium]
MTAAERRKKILSLIKQSDKPLSGAELGRLTGVSRQVVVQDMALLRTEGHPIVATARGYVIEQAGKCVRMFKLCHTNEQTEDELTAIVDLGGCVLDVMVNHRIYGKMTAPLNIRNRRDVQGFMRDIQSGKSTALMNVTSGYHFHNVSADSEEILDEIEQVLRDRNYLSQLLPYEKEDI